MTTASAYYPSLGLLERKNLTVYSAGDKTVFLDNVTLVSIYKEKKSFAKLFEAFLGERYHFVIFLKNDKQIEFSFSKEKLAMAIELKNEIIKRKLILSE